MKEAIQKAIEGGYKDIKHAERKYDCIDGMRYLTVYFSHSSEAANYDYDEILFDKEFWQSLGKALGWPDDKLAYYSLVEIDGEIENGKIPLWHYHWHRFIDHLAEGKEAEKFFTSLLLSNES